MCRYYIRTHAHILYGLCTSILGFQPIKVSQLYCTFCIITGHTVLTYVVEKYKDQYKYGSANVVQLMQLHVNIMDP